MLLGVTESLAKKLKTLRKAAKLTQQELANKAGYDTGTVAKIEQGKNTNPETITLRSLEQALGAERGELYAAPPAPDRDWAATVERYLRLDARGENTTPEVRERLRYFASAPATVDTSNIEHVHHARMFLEAVWHDRAPRVSRGDVPHEVLVFIAHEQGLTDADREYLMSANYGGKSPTDDDLRRMLRKRR